MRKLWDHLVLKFVLIPIDKYSDLVTHEVKLKCLRFKNKNI